MDDEPNESISTTSDYESVDIEQKKPLSSFDIESNDFTKTQEKCILGMSQVPLDSRIADFCLFITLIWVHFDVVSRILWTENSSDKRKRFANRFYEKQLQEAMKIEREESKEEIRQLKAQNSLLYEKISELISQTKEVEQRQKLMFAESMRLMEKKIIKASQDKKTNEKPKKKLEADIQIPPANCSYFCLFLHESENVISHGFYYFRYPFTLVFCKATSTVFAACPLALIFASLIELIIAKAWQACGAILGSTILIVRLVLLVYGFNYSSESIKLCFTGKSDFDFS
ncbi:hypothetical protein M3Y98_00708900 [Aphelenchoides besseyi]|nr:hypothetical protein M3Y98_00708900 [Aphelenchoides besseyi]